jgi:hypothetical protein
MRPPSRPSWLCAVRRRRLVCRLRDAYFGLPFLANKRTLPRFYLSADSGL